VKQYLVKAKAQPTRRGLHQVRVGGVRLGCCSRRVCVCVSLSGVLFSVGVCVCDLLIFLTRRRTRRRAAPSLDLAFTRYSFTLRLLCTNQSSLYCLPPLALPTIVQYYCTYIAQHTTPPRPPLAYAIHCTILAMQYRVKANLRLGCSVAYSIYSIGGCYTCYMVYYTIALHSVLDANFGI